MTKMRLTLTTLAVSAVLMAAASAQATTLRAYVSSTGNDANAGANCPQATPCRTFAGAYPTVTAGGELIALDTSGYGPLTGANTITKAITIAAVPGSTAFVVAATGTAGFTITAGATDQIILRNLSFNGNGAANTTGVQQNTSRLFVDHCIFTSLTIGLSVLNSKADVLDGRFVANTTALKADGPGADFPSSTPPYTSTTMVRVNGGDFLSNGTAFFMANPGARTCPQCGGNKINIAVIIFDSNWRTNAQGNTTLANGSGTGCVDPALDCKQVYAAQPNQNIPN